MTAGLVERAEVHSCDAGNQLAHDVEREQTGESHHELDSSIASTQPEASESGRGEDPDHKHEEGLER